MHGAWHNGAEPSARPFYYSEPQFSFQAVLGACRRNAKPSDSRDDFSHLGDDFRGLIDLWKRKSLEFRAAYPTF